MHSQDVLAGSRSIVGFVVLLTAFVMICPNASALQTIDLSDTAGANQIPMVVFNLDSLDLDELKIRAATGMPIALDVLAQTIQYVPAPVQIEGVDARSMASQGDPVAAKAYAGTHCEGATDVRMTVSSDWVHFSFTLDGVDYMIDPVSDVAAANQYYVHSVRDSADMAQYSDLSDAVVLSSAQESEALSDTAPASVTDTNASVNSTAFISETSPTAEDSASSTKESRGGNGTTGCVGGDPINRLCTIICAADAEFRTMYPNDWQNRILSVVNDMGGRWESQVLVSFRISMYVAVNFATDFSSSLLSDFEDFMDTDPMRSAKRNVAHLFTGKDLLDDWRDTGDMGISYEAGVRRATFDNVYHEDIEYGLAYSISEQWHDSSSNMWLLGHELGHNFNGISTYHVHFSPPPPLTWPWYIDSWMADSFGTFSLGGTAVFSDNNKARIKSWASQALDHIRTSNPVTSSVSDDNLQSSNIYMELSDWGADALPVHQAAKQMKVAFAIKNTGTSGLTLDWLFVGARNAAGTNKDFGHIYNVFIGAGQTYNYSTTYSFPSGGTWALWPAYKISGHYGPYQWIVINPALYYKQKEWKDHADTSTSLYMDLWYRFLVLTPTAAPTKGSTVTVSFTLFNSIEGTSTTAYTYIFTAARINMNEAYNRDFGHSGQQVLTQNCTYSDPTGGGYHLLATRTLDMSGTWYFWPCYYYSGFGPWTWHYLSIVVP